MADTTYTIAVETTQAQKNIDNLKNKVKTLNDRFGDLKNAIAGLAIGTAIAQATKFADTISDMSDATGIAVSTMLGFNKALMANGGDSEAATNSLGKFVQTIGDAVGGSESAQKAFSEVGVSLKDIQTLSEEDLLKKTVQGLAGIENSAKRVAAQVALFGKASRSVNFQGVGENMGPAAQASEKYAEAIRAGAAAQQSLEVNLKNLTMALLEVTKPMNELIGKINISTDAFVSLIKTLTYAVAAYLAFARGLPLVTKIMDGLSTTVKAAGGAWALLMTQLTKMGNALKSIVLGIGRAIGVISGGTSAVFSFAAAIAGLLRFLLRFGGVTSIILAVAEAVNFLSKQFFNFDIIDAITTKIGKLYNAAKEYFNLGDKGAGAGRGGTAETLKAQQEQAEKMRKEYESAKEKAAEFAERQSKLAMEINKVGEAMKFVNDRQLQQIALETRLIGKNEEEQEVARTLAALYEKQEDAIKGLLEKKQEWARGTEEQKASLGLIDAEIAKVKELTNIQAQSLPAYIANLQAARLIEKDRLQVLDDITKAIERQATLGDQLRSANDKMKDVQFEASQQGKSPLQQQFDQIREDARKAALEAGRAYAAAFEDGGDGLSSEKAKELADGLAQIAERYKQIAEAQIANVEASRSFEAGWKEAFNTYMDSATNAANKAKNMFDAVTNGMNSAIDNFVENGKFSFGDLASSIIKDLIKIELKASAMQLWKLMGAGGGGGGGILSGITSMLGFAGGGDPPIGKASIVGENGPEIISPRGATTITPLTGQQQAPVYNITNNISAVDAAGVARLFTSNRQLLLGTIEQARKENPSMSRGR